MIYQQEFVVEPNIRNGFEALAIDHGLYITNIKPEPPDERNTRYTLESQREHDFDAFEDDLKLLYQSGWALMTLTYLDPPYGKAAANDYGQS